MGARPQPEDALAEPVNAWEAVADADGWFRRLANEALAGPYSRLFAKVDRLVWLAPPSFDVVVGWRAQAERELRAATGRGMTDAEVVAFVARFERVTRWMIEDMRARADVVVELDADRGVGAIRFSPAFDRR